MTVLIQIHYLAIEDGVRSLQRGLFPLKGKKREQVAYEFWRWIKKEIPVEIAIEKVIADVEDIRELVKGLNEAPLN